METLIESIRVAVQRDATDEAKHQGALACRTILTALEAKAGEPLVTPTQAPTDAPPAAQGNQTPMPAPPPIGPQQVAAIVGALRGTRAAAGSRDHAPSCCASIRDGRADGCASSLPPHPDRSTRRERRREGSRVVMREFYEYDDPNGELMRRLERDEEKEPRPRFKLPPRRKQFRYWSSAMF